MEKEERLDFDPNPLHAIDRLTARLLFELHGLLGARLAGLYLHGSLALQAQSDCRDCPTGIDLTNVYFTVSLFANTLQANCAQVARTVYTATGQMAGRVATYEDLWRLTIANYHAGPGCTSFAIHQAWETQQTLNWDVVRSRFTEPKCRSSALRRAAPSPGTPSSTDAVARVDRRWRWYAIVNRCASSRTRCSR